ncbi:hypothetical protein JP75_00160 [Devosia riboflavina]|uniref:Uncharacterized protein n=1 Tax=Devosia riboflavina TaxID=46914 RepID=A0A087M6W5_9HYPH|nr:hypothetical protein [Devosia riboflavina]KFL32618.1 hypothetical protein JP75_00160 [Devosia riboflavina]
MKIVALIEDGLGHRHLVASRSPDLLRRELAARTRTAMLIWCAVPPEYHSAATIVTKAMDRLGADGPEALAAIPVNRIVKVLVDLCVTEPRRTARWRRIKRRVREIGQWFPGNWRGAAPAEHLRSPSA